MTQNNTTGAVRLYKILTGEYPTPNSLPYDTDAEIRDDLPMLEYVQPYAFNLDDYTNHMKLRSRIRYLAALFPDEGLNSLSHRIHGIINNSNFSVDDIRLILNGRKLNDPSSITREISLPIIQGIGRCLRDGKSIRSTARDMRVSYDTVEGIERYLGIRQAREDKIMDGAISAVRDGLSVRKFAHSAGISKGKAHRLIIKAHSVLTELGEVKVNE
jgi:transposase-like protein